MHFPTAVVLLSALSYLCAADWLELYQRCTHRDTCEGLGYFHTNDGEWEVSGNDGCHRTRVPNLNEFCIDWRLGRAHFRFRGQGDKRCMFQTRTERWKKCAFKYCWKHTFEEIGCYWFMSDNRHEDNGALPFTMENPERG
ncbi:hypothetical protein BB8028_0003g07400 [Beauveria bassiana]|uniref:Uncharacterized protein n=1 Tax=Beauveria bassiana TaxID=176275 RepID=A0A2S7Y8C6_BEABA|nr:hypothetical protein BB8028_0003g07400 [Beauveria bassiana]